MTDIVESSDAVAKTVVLSPSKTAEKVSPAKSMTEQEKLQVRIKKFGAQTEEVKKITRAERFGTKAEENGASAKLNERAARFGIETKEAKAASAAAVKTSPDVSKEVLEKRANRFGNVKEEAPKGTDEALNKRKERFGTFAEDDKKKLRSERFQKS